MLAKKKKNDKEPASNTGIKGVLLKFRGGEEAVETNELKRERDRKEGSLWPIKTSLPEC